MIKNLPGYSVPPKIAVQFLERFSPFKELDSISIEQLAKEVEVEFYPKGAVLFRQHLTEVTHFHVIQKGSVQVFVRSESENLSLKNLGGEGETLGASWLISDEKPDVTVEALEDTFCFLIPKAIFLKFLSEQPSFELFFRDEFQRDRISQAYSETRIEGMRSIGMKRYDYFSTRVSDIIRPNFHFVNSSSKIQEAARTMAKLRIGSLLVRDSPTNILGIITKKDLRTKVVAVGLDYNHPVSEIMSAPVLTIPVQARLFEATLRMVRRQISHLPAVKASQVVGIITTHDIMVHQAASPVILFREIKSRQTADAMNELSRKIPGVVRNLIEEGARAYHCTNVISLFHDRIFVRALKLFSESPRSVRPFFLLLGKAARMEQTLLPTYDYAVIYQNGIEQSDKKTSDHLLEKRTLQLNNFFESCFGDNLILKTSGANPRWRKPLGVWSTYMEEWISNPIPPEIAVAKKFLDMRAVTGENATTLLLKRLFFKRISSSRSFMKSLAEDFLNVKPPVSFLGKAIVEENGAQTPGLDLENRVGNPFSDFARLMCFKISVESINTLDRFKALYESGAISHGIYSEATEFYEFQTQLVLINQLKDLDADVTPSYIVDPSSLSELEKRTLKETFSLLLRLQAIVKRKFP
ncbi:MAG: putative nucleotidyltransferase substrate binding domain-containing protein [Desulfomonilaceae bacterium]|jgi:CBS domain-containing protein